MDETNIVKHEANAVAATESVPTNAQQMAFQLIKGGADVASVKEFLAMSREMAADAARSAFDQAIAAAKAKIPVIQKNKHVGFDSRKAGAARTDYWHEDFAQVARTVDPILSEFGLSYRFEASQEGPVLSVTCVLSHREGHSTRTTLSAGNDTTGNKNAIQSVGSTATFLQRYTLKLALGLSASKDDDGRSSSEETSTLSEEQVEELNDMIDKAVEARPDTDRGAWLESFLAYMKSDSMMDISANDFTKAKAAIENAIRQQGAKK